jgi:hypothetical protein
MIRRLAQNTSRTYYATYTQRDRYASAVRSLAAIGLTSRDIGEALRIGTAAAAQLVGSRDGNRR